jgi:hypothetical protein
MARCHMCQKEVDIWIPVCDETIPRDSIQDYARWCLSCVRGRKK